jgi:hypothetical protein
VRSFSRRQRESPRVTLPQPGTYQSCSFASTRPADQRYFPAHRIFPASGEELFVQGVRQIRSALRGKTSRTRSGENVGDGAFSDWLESWKARRGVNDDLRLCYRVGGSREFDRNSIAGVNKSLTKCHDVNQRLIRANGALDKRVIDLESVVDNLTTKVWILTGALSICGGIILWLANQLFSRIH